jgi:hypothetical protein
MNNLVQRFTTKSASRGPKYLVLGLATIVLLCSIFLTYTYYEIRRHLDANVRAVDQRLSTEEVMFKFAQLRNVKREIYVLRCLQRDAIAAYRAGTKDVRHDLSQIYAHTLVLRETMLKQIDEWETTRRKENKRPVVDLDKTKEKLKLSWGLTRFDDIVNLQAANAEDITELRNFINGKLKEEHRKFNQVIDDITAKSPTLKANIDKMGSDLDAGLITLEERNMSYLKDTLQKADQSIFDLSYVGALQTRIERLEENIKAQKLETSNWLGVAIQKRMAELPFLNVDSPENALNIVIEEFGDPQRGGEVQLLDLNCAPVDAAASRLIERKRIVSQARIETGSRTGSSATVAAAGGGDDARPGSGSAAVATLDVVADAQTILDAGAKHSQVPEVAGLLMASQSSDGWLSNYVSRLFALPTTIITYLVTILFGMLGAVTICTLRLSQHGVWDEREDPPWSSILIAPLLGAVAATAIYLLWSVGLLVAAGSGTGRESSVGGAAFVGLLGFLSGLLHEDAFGKLKLVGEGWFRPDGAPDTGATAVDRELAEKLREIGCHRLAELTLVHRPGKSLADRPEFTLVALDDEYLDNASDLVWFELRQRSGASMFDRMTLTRKLDLATPPAAVNTVAAPAVSVPAGKDGAFVKVGQARLDPQKQVAWRNGLIVSAGGEI